MHYCNRYKDVNYVIINFHHSQLNYTSWVCIPID